MKHRASVQGGVRAVVLDHWCPLEVVSSYAICAIIHAEDPTFFRHGGFWWDEMKRQIRTARASGKHVKGVSTITQQLARNLYLRPERTFKRKAQEAIIAVELERALSKRRILELYVNVVEWGADIWGIHAAAHAYFQCPPDQLSPFEAVFLASLLPAPRVALTGANATRAIRAQRRLTSLLYGSGIISHTQERETYSRISDLEATANEGGDLTPSFLARRSEASYRPSADSLTVAHVIAAECGLAKRCHYECFVQEAGPYLRAISKWPEWWPPAVQAWATPSPRAE